MVHHSTHAHLLQSFLPLASSKYCWICAALILSVDVTGKPLLNCNCIQGIKIFTHYKNKHTTIDWHELHHRAGVLDPISQSYELIGTMLWPTMFRAQDSFHKTDFSRQPSTTQQSTFEGAAGSRAALSSEIACEQVVLLFLTR